MTADADPDADDPLQWTAGAQPRLLPYGATLFPAMCEAIAQAKHSVWLQTYIFRPGGSADAVLDALCDAGRRGVQVRVLVDGLGSAASIDFLAARFAQSGVEFMVFRPWRRWADVLQRGRWRRLHRKLCTVDGQIGFIGGINIIDDRFDIHHGWSAQPRLDYAMQFSGRLALQAQWSMQRVWLRTALTGALQRRLRGLPGPRPLQSGQSQRAYWREVLDWNEQPLPLQTPHRRAFTGLAALAPLPAGEELAALVLRDNLTQRRAIEHAYERAIRASRQRVLIISPYFYPGRNFRDALKAAAARGVDVRLLLQGRVDYRIAAWMARALYGEMLRAGVRIFEYTPAFLHAKVAVVDDDWATVGSSNIDPLSLLVNLEANVVVRSRPFAAALAAHIEGEMARGQPIDTPQRLRTRAPWWLRPFVALVARAFVALAGGLRERY